MTLATSQIPSHTHSYDKPIGGAGGHAIYGNIDYSQNANTGATGGGGSHTHGNTAATTPGAGGSTTPGATGSTTPGNSSSAGAHTHTIQAPRYIDVIICSKDA
jgi:hypothetical protein